jgi:beta-lactamase class A
LSHAVSTKALNVALVDITDAQHPVMASANGDNMMYAASLPKIGILLGAFERIHDGDMQLDAGTREQLTKMIRYSSNAAATAMYNAVGPEYLARILSSDTYGLYDPQYNGGLWVGRPYAKAGTWKRDPLHNISHGATALQVARFLYLLDTGRLVSPEMSQEMKKILGRPAINHKFVKGLNKNRPGSKIFRKSGSWHTYHADCAIVERAGHKYIAVALANDARGSAWLSRLIVKMDDIVFNRDASALQLAAVQ